LKRCRTYLGIFGEMSKLMLIAGFASLLGPPLYAQDIAIRVLDGRNGRPITDERVQVWVNGEKGRAADLPADKQGIALLHLDDKPVRSIQIEANLYFDCRPFRKNSPRPAYSTVEILQSGVVTENVCGKFRRESKAGELVFFVRPLHWWEVFRR